jgi:hypothetical protein
MPRPQPSGPHPLRARSRKRRCTSRFFPVTRFRPPPDTRITHPPASAILPCFWVYADVAARLAPAAEDVLRNDPEHPYARWVTTYDSDEFRTIVDGARILVDDAAASATEAQREAMVDAFSVATRYELMFWDSALHPTPWLRDESEVLL